MKERPVDLPQLFSDVSRTVSGIKSLMGSSSSSTDQSDGEDSSTSSSPLGGMCFKACGMEDIQFAARAAGDLLHSARLCLLVSTTISLLCLLLLTTLVIYAVCKRIPPKSSSFVHTFFPSTPSSKTSST